MYALQGARETFYTGVNLLMSKTCVPEKKCGARIGVDSVQRQRPDIHAMGGGFPGRYSIPYARSQPTNKVQATVRRVDFQDFSEFPLRRFHKDSLSLGVQQPHASQVTLEMALADEVSQHRLFEDVGVDIGAQMGGDEPVHKRWWCYNVAQPKPREERLAEGTNVDDTVSSVDAL